MIRCIDLTTSSREHVDLEITPGAFVCLQGDDASEILSLLLGGTAPDHGTVEVDGINIASLPSPLLELYRRKLGSILYETPLISFWTVREHFSLLLAEGDQLALESRIEQYGISDLLDVLPDDLSSEEESKVLLARACFHRPQILLVDMSILDSRTHTLALAVLERISQQGTTVIVAGLDAALATAKGMMLM